MSNVVVNSYQYSVPSVEECWQVAGLNDGSNFGTATHTNTAICSGVADPNNGMYDWGVVKSVAVFLCCPSGLTGGTFRTGVWDSTGANKAQSNQFTCSDMAVGTSYSQVVKLSKTLTSSTTIADGDRVGVIFGSGIGGIGTLEKQHSVLREKGPSRVSPFFVPMIISDIAAGIISMKLGAKGPNYATVSACASAAHAIGEAARKIQYDEADLMITGGCEAAVTALSVAGFASAKAMSHRRGISPWRRAGPFMALIIGTSMSSRFQRRCLPSQ